MTHKVIKINVPVLARVEGEGALDITITDQKISQLQLRIYEPPRYFEKFLEGRGHQQVVDAVARICGICPVAYQMSAVHAIENIFNTSISSWVRNMRRVMYCGEWLQSHSLHIHMLAAPDYLGYNSVIEMSKTHPLEVQRGLALQSLGNDLMAMLGGRSVHPIGVCIGGFFSAPDQDTIAAMRVRLQAAGADAEALVHWTASLDLPNDEQEFTCVALCHTDEYPMNEGRIVSDAGLDIDISEYEQHFSEFQQSHSTALHSHLHGQPYLVGPLARLNLNHDKLPAVTRSVMENAGLKLPIRNMFHSIVARAVEIHYVIHEALRLLENYALPQSSHVLVQPRAGIGFGCTEAPRGLLWHRYQLDEQGNVVTARIVPPTSQNQARIEQDIGVSLTHIGLDQDEEILRLHAEKVIRNYDPCISCATHFLKLNIKHTNSATHNATPGRVCGSEKVITESMAVIGIGSPQGNDTLGWDVVKQLAQDQSFTENGNISFIQLDRPGPRLLEYFHNHQTVVVIDAISGSQPPGTLIEANGAIIAAQCTSLSSHEFGLAKTLALGYAMEDIIGDVIVMGLDNGGQLDWHYSIADIHKLVAAVRHKLLR